MAINIKDAETDTLARQLSALTGESITETIRGALEARLRRLEAAERRRARAADLQKYLERARLRSVLDTRTEDEILGYDERGIPA